MKYNTQPMAPYIAWGLATVIGILIGYLAGYAKKKGENRAMHEDIEKVVEQMSAVTTATKNIEAKISSDVWDKQKRWELKREVLFDAAKRVAEVDDAMLTHAIMMLEDQAKQKAWAAVPPSPEQQLSWAETKNETVTRWSKASTAFDESRLFVAIVCGKDANEAFEDLGGFISIIVSQIVKNPSIYRISRADLLKKILVARNAIRKELEVDV